ncbi:virion structural protein [Sulfolobus virus Ragged Hills]|uniref:VP3 n=1 Tax=Sulfolobus virus Ragged Hills TaxID=256994 RepID=Q6TRS7_9VIRU|nr:virion structural protein [Sulfolobus virus Ragged Hills]AAR27934.1 VP3 [Sulfolobus virus Ragged Hills]
MESNVKAVIFLFIFILIGVVLFQPIYNEVVYVTTSGTYTTYTTVSGTLTETTSSFIPNPQYVGSSNATVVSLVPVFYLLVLIIVPAVIGYRLYKSE